MTRKNGFTLAVMTAVLLSATSGFAGKFNKTLSVGDKAPDWKNLVGVDEKKHALDEYSKADAIVLVFTCNQCPVAVACEDRLVELQKDYQGKNVQVIAVNVNNVEGDKLDKMKERASTKGFNFPYLYDPTQVIAREYGARVTPDIVVLDKNRKVAYTGMIDNSPLNESEVKARHLRDAIDSVLAGKSPAVAETKAQGCGIKFE